MEAARMFAHGATQAEVARTFGVSAQAASIWYRRWRQGGAPALRGAGRRPSWRRSTRHCARGHKRSGSTPTYGRWRGWQR
jgi:transposase-like protein